MASQKWKHHKFNINKRIHQIMQNHNDWRK